MVITEAELREWWQNGRGEIPALPAGAQFTPAAADFLREQHLSPRFAPQAGPVLFNPQHPVSLHPPAALCAAPLNNDELGRPYAARTVLTASDVFGWPARGITVFELDDTLTLTDQAFETALDLGIRVLRKKTEPPSALSPVSFNPAVYPAPELKMEQDVPVSKKFYTDVDIEALCQSGKTCLELDDNVVLTDLAREKAARLGLALVRKPAAPATPATATPSENDLFVQVKTAVMSQLRGPVDEAVVDAVIRKVLAGVRGG